jgi:putative aldouronate transport system permease protein
VVENSRHDRQHDMETPHPTLMSNRTRLLKRLVRERYLWLLLVPGLAWYCIFCYAPMYGLIIAFKDFSPYKGIAGSRWVGLLWFRQFFDSVFFWRLIRNTILINVYSLLFSFPVPVILAILINEMRSKAYQKAAQTISYLPHFISTVIVVGMLVNFVDTQGVINNLVEALGGRRINFMVQPGWFRPLYIMSGIWQSAGWDSIIYLAALSGIDPQLYEAATVDGAGKLRQLWHISLACILPTIVIMFILNVGSLLDVGFEKIFLMYNPATYETADVISTYIYRRGILSGDFGFGAAVGLFQAVINFILIVAANRASRRISSISLW